VVTAANHNSLPRGVPGGGAPRRKRFFAVCPMSLGGGNLGGGKEKKEIRKKTNPTKEL